MRYLAALLLASCGGTGAADVLMPDELTVGHGTGTHSGSAFRSDPIAHYDGESETSYAALTWSLPSFEDDRLTQDERRAIREYNLERDQESSDSTGTAQKGDAKAPPIWLPAAIFGILFMGFFGFWIASKRKQTWL